MRILEITGASVLLDDDLYDWAINYSWCLVSGYAYNRRYGYMHHNIISATDGLVRDHINRDRLDNRRKNLRVVTRAQNNQNHGLSRSNTSGQVGISWHKRGGKWMAYHYHDDKRTYLGLHETKSAVRNAIDALIARLKEEI